MIGMYDYERPRLLSAYYTPHVVYPASVTYTPTMNLHAASATMHILPVALKVVPADSHVGEVTAIKTIVCYLSCTIDQGTIVTPTGNLNLDCYVDADFASLHQRDPDRSPSSAKSRTGFIIMLGGCPILWKSQLQTEVSLSTLEAEYSALSMSMRTLLPLRSLLLEVINGLQLPTKITSNINCTAFEDNNGALLLATKQRITNRTKYFLVKWHFFWSHVRNGSVTIHKIDTKDQRADYLTKGLNREAFERVRKLVQGW